MKNTALRWLKRFCAVIGALGLVFFVALWLTTYHPDDVQAEPVTCAPNAPVLKKGEEVIKEGDKEFFLVVIEGGCEIRHEGKKVATIESGQHFGESQISLSAVQFCGTA